MVRPRLEFQQTLEFNRGSVFSPHGPPPGKLAAWETSIHPHFHRFW